MSGKEHVNEGTGSRFGRLVAKYCYRWHSVAAETGKVASAAAYDNDAVAHKALAGF